MNPNPAVGQADMPPDQPHPFITRMHQLINEYNKRNQDIRMNDPFLDPVTNVNSLSLASTILALRVSCPGVIYSQARYKLSADISKQITRSKGAKLVVAYQNMPTVICAIADALPLNKNLQIAANYIRGTHTIDGNLIGEKTVLRQPEPQTAIEPVREPVPARALVPVRAPEPVPKASSSHTKPTPIIRNIINKRPSTLEGRVLELLNEVPCVTQYPAELRRIAESIMNSTGVSESTTLSKYVNSKASLECTDWFSAGIKRTTPDPKTGIDEDRWIDFVDHWMVEFAQMTDEQRQNTASVADLKRKYIVTCMKEKLPADEAAILNKCHTKPPTLVKGTTDKYEYNDLDINSASPAARPEVIVELDQYRLGNKYNERVNRVIKISSWHPLYLFVTDQKHPKNNPVVTAYYYITTVLARGNDGNVSPLMHEQASLLTYLMTKNELDTSFNNGNTIGNNLGLNNVIDWCFGPDEISTHLKYNMYWNGADGINGLLATAPKARVLVNQINTVTDDQPIPLAYTPELQAIMDKVNIITYASYLQEKGKKPDFMPWTAARLRRHPVGANYTVVWKWFHAEVETYMTDVRRILRYIMVLMHRGLDRVQLADLVRIFPTDDITFYVEIPEMAFWWHWNVYHVAQTFLTSKRDPRHPNTYELFYELGNSASYLELSVLEERSIYLHEFEGADGSKPNAGTFHYKLPVDGGTIGELKLSDEQRRVCELKYPVLKPQDFKKQWRELAKLQVLLINKSAKAAKKPPPPPQLTAAERRIKDAADAKRKAQLDDLAHAQKMKERAAKRKREELLARQQEDLEDEAYEKKRKEDLEKRARIEQSRKNNKADEEARSVKNRDQFILADTTDYNQFHRDARTKRVELWRKALQQRNDADLAMYENMIELDENRLPNPTADDLALFAADREERARELAGLKSADMPDVKNDPMVE